MVIVLEYINKILFGYELRNLYYENEKLIEYFYFRKDNWNFKIYIGYRVMRKFYFIVVEFSYLKILLVKKKKFLFYNSVLKMGIYMLYIL